MEFFDTTTTINHTHQYLVKVKLSYDSSILYLCWDKEAWALGASFVRNLSSVWACGGQLMTLQGLFYRLLNQIPLSLGIRVSFYLQMVVGRAPFTGEMSLLLQGDREKGQRVLLVSAIS